MPTASPIIVIIMVTKKISSETWPTIPTAASARAMATMASPIGSRAATTAPKRASRMISATGTPKRSPCSKSRALSSLFSKATLASPPMSTRKSSAASASSTTWMTVLDVLRRLFQVAGEEEQHRRGSAVGGDQEVGGHQERAVGRVVVLSELHDAGPERRDLREHRLDLGLEGGGIDGQRRGLDDDHLAGRAGTGGIPNLGALLHQIGRALRFVSAGQPELGRGRAGEQGPDDRQRDHYQQNPGGDREPRPARADAGQ